MKATQTLPPQTRGIEQSRERPQASTLGKQVMWRLYLSTLVINDLVMMVVAFKLAYWIRFERPLWFFYLHSSPPIQTYNLLVWLYPPIWIGIFWAVGLYQQKNLLGGPEEYGRVFRGVSSSLFILTMVGFLDPNIIIARGWLLLVWGLGFTFTSIGRFLLRRVVYLLRRKGYFLSRALIVGANAEGLSLAHQLSTWQTSGLRVVGFIDKKLPVGATPIAKLRVLGKPEQLDEVIKHYDIEELILASSAISTHDKMLEIFKQYGVSEDINVRMSSGLYEIITTGLSVKEFAYVPLVGINKVRLTGIDRLFKLLLDYSLGSVALILASPFMALIALAVKLDSPGPIIHRRKVMGVNGRHFEAYKFRTMAVNGDEILERFPELKAELEKNYKLKDDPRVTRVGRFLRKFSLDELPQIFNVLRHEMALVGPRMICPNEMQAYTQWGINLLTVRPGITGLWQVSGRSDITYEERVRLDMHYIRNWSIWLDLQLIWRTIPAVLLRKGAY